MGTEARDANRQVTNAEILTRSIDDRRQSISGVAMDEEMSNLVRFQRAYQASARAMSTMDEMLDVLINRTGRVGL
jgi:flagellar hook-associated protein 1 FlgK